MSLLRPGVIKQHIVKPLKICTSVPGVARELAVVSAYGADIEGPGNVLMDGAQSRYGHVDKTTKVIRHGGTSHDPSCRGELATRKSRCSAQRFRDVATEISGG